MEQINLKKEKIEEILNDLGMKLPKHKFDIYIPSKSFNPKDIISVQKEASRMLKHIGMDGYIATITYEKTKDGTGGFINLNYDKDVWITVDKSSNHLKDKVLAVMAHEICHKYLFVNGVHFPKPFDNLLEWYTDLATIYVGFSILTLNGCKIQTSSKFQDRVFNTTHLTGYLVKSNYEYAHLIILSANKQCISRYNKYLTEKISFGRIIKYRLNKYFNHFARKHP